jgi:DNA helicase-2/ATP-dependent DNA helicase PcrA
MGITGVETVTFNSWALSIIRNAIKGNVFFKYRDLPDFVERIKFSDEILKALSHFVDKKIKDVDLMIFHEFAAKEKLLQLWKGSNGKALQPRLKDFKHDVSKSDLIDEEKKTALDYVQALLAKQEDFIGDLYDLLSDEKLLSSFLPAEPKLEEHLSYLSRMIENNRNKNNLDYYDMSLILRLIQLKYGGLPNKIGGVSELDHLVIDEAQDFGPVEFAIMMDAVGDKRNLTIVGDVSQKILFSRKFIGWNNILNNLKIKKDSLIQLEISFRCTVPIMNLARKIEGRKDPVPFGRPGNPVTWHRAVDQNDFLETLAHWTNNLLEKDPYKLIALICRYPKQAMELKDELENMLSHEVRVGHRDQFSFEPGVMVSNIHQIKGLEFDAVALIDPSEKSYPGMNSESRNMIYVGVTRAQEDLLVIGRSPFSTVLL